MKILNWKEQPEIWCWCQFPWGRWVNIQQTQSGWDTERMRHRAAETRLINWVRHRQTVSQTQRRPHWAGEQRDRREQTELDWRQETGDRRQETGDRRQETGDRRQETGDRRQETRAEDKLGKCSLDRTRSWNQTHESFWFFLLILSCSTFLNIEWT